MESLIWPGITDDDANAILNLFNWDLGAAIDFVNEQERAINEEHAIQNLPPDEDTHGR